MKVEVLKYSISIDAKPEKIWEVLFSPDTFSIWTAPFSEGSFFKGNWEQGSKMLFLMINKKGLEEGMVSEIAENRYPFHLSIRHLGYVIDGKEDTESDEVKSWAPVYEKYTLTTQENGHTLLEAYSDIVEEMVDIFNEAWPKSLEKVKQLSES